MNCDDTIIFWVIGRNSVVLTEHAKFCGRELTMVIPLKGKNSIEINTKEILREWKPVDGSEGFRNIDMSKFENPLLSSSNFHSPTIYSLIRELYKIGSVSYFSLSILKFEVPLEFMSSSYVTASMSLLTSQICQNYCNFVI